MENAVTKVKTIKRISFAGFAVEEGSLVELVDDFERELAIVRLSGRSKGASQDKRARVYDYEALRIKGAVRFVNRASLERDEKGALVLYTE